MTHEELLKKIKAQEEYWTNLVHYTKPEFYENTVDQRNAWQALKALVELHKPNQETDFMIDDIYSSIRTYRLCCEVCHKSQDPKAPQLYPCPTIQAIEKELS